MRKALLLIPLLYSFALQAQVTFTNANSQLINSDVHSGVGIAVADMNNDRLDDMVRLDQGNIITIDYQTIDGTFERATFNTVSNESQWTLAVGDLDNNGYKDIMCGGSYDDIKIYFANNDGSAYDELIMPGQSMFAQGSNFADINNDGFLDAFVCHDDAESRIWENMKDKTFNMADAMIDMATTPASDNSGNYGSIWTDFDHDGDTDLYIAKCRQGVGSSSDPRRINALFVNDGQGNYTEAAEDYGLKIGDQSWTADFEDIDNDGDFDCFLTSHSGDAQMLENDGSGHFTDISDLAGIGNLNFSIQAKMVDMDNDGFVDLIVSGGENAFFKNNGDKTFTRQTDWLDNVQMLTFALGDLNQDGFTDINAGYGSIYTNPSNTDDVLWMNDGNDNNWIAFNLEGTDSNRDAVGTIVKITGPWGVQIREVRSGESYGISNSHGVRFGLGDATEVTQVDIEWPSGNTQTILDLTSNQYVYVQEAGCVSGGVTIEPSGALTFCTGGSVTLTVPEGFDGYTWSNGMDGNEITVTETGGYQVVVANGDCNATSNIINVVVDPDETPTIMEGTEEIICPGSEFTLTSSEATSGNYIWSNDAVGQSIQVSTPGTYSVVVEGLCGDFTSEEFILENYLVEIETVNDTVMAGETALLQSTGLDPQWYDAPIGGTLVATGNDFTTGPINATTDYFVESMVELGAPEERVGLENNTDLGGAFTNEFFSGIRMDIISPVKLQEFTVYANSAGERTISFFDQGTNTFLGEFDVDLVMGENVVSADFDLEPGEDITMYIYNDADLFSVTDGDDLDFPYISDEGTVTITAGTNFQQYDFFFNLKFKGTEGTLCDSERELVQAVLATDVSTRDFVEAFSLEVHPNPTSGLLYVQTDLDNMDRMQIEIRDGLGAVIDSRMFDQSVDLSNLAKGVYFINFTNEKGTITRKVILQ